LTEYGRALGYLGDFPEAERAFRRSWRILEEAFGGDHTAVAFPMSGLAGMLRAVGRTEESMRLFETALAIRETAYGPIHNEVLWTVAGYGWALRAAGEVEAAEAAFRRTIEVSRSLFPTAHYLEGYGEMGLGAVLEDRGDPEALRHLERSLEIVSAVYPPDNLRLGWPLLHLGTFLRDQGDCGGSRPLLDRAAAVWSAGLGERNIVTAESLLALAMWEQRCGDPALARQRVADLATLADTYELPEHPVVVDIRRAYDQLIAAERR
jgi:tetratricopeptide (TPR) repeat protein